MAMLTRQLWPAVTALLVPFLTLANPAWLTLAGVPPAWSVLWLLPWALVEGPVGGALAGLAVGLLLDALHPDGASLVPGLCLLGLWWGHLGRRGPPLRRSLDLGLLALCGSLGLGLSLMAQWALLSWSGRGAAPVAVTDAAARGMAPALLALPGWHWDDLLGAGLPVLLAQTLLTALLAPMLCSLQLLLWRRSSSGWRA